MRSHRGSPPPLLLLPRAAQTSQTRRQPCRPVPSPRTRRPHQIDPLPCCWSPHRPTPSDRRSRRRLRAPRRPCRSWGASPRRRQRRVRRPTGGRCTMRGVCLGRAVESPSVRHSDSHAPLHTACQLPSRHRLCLWQLSFGGGKCKRGSQDAAYSRQWAPAWSLMHVKRGGVASSLSILKLLTPGHQTFLYIKIKR